MEVKSLTPILNVSSLVESFAWFERLGWNKGWKWGDPPGFGGVCSGEVEIFLCENGQGGRGKGENISTFGEQDAEMQDKGVWMSFWVDDVDAVHRHCVEKDIEVTFPPTDLPWFVRECHIRHPDGHVFRISESLNEDVNE